MRSAKDIARDAARRIRQDVQGDGHMGLGGPMPWWKGLLYWPLVIAGWVIVGLAWGAVCVAWYWIAK